MPLPRPSASGSRSRRRLAERAYHSGLPDSGQQVTPGSGLGVNQPLVTIGNTILGAGNALLSGAQRFAYESIAPYSKTLARDVAGRA